MNEILEIQSLLHEAEKKVIQLQEETASTSRNSDRLHQVRIAIWKAKDELAEVV